MISLLTPDLGNVTIRYIHFFSSIIWWGIMFFMFVIVFPVNKDGRYSTLFPRVQRFMKIIASIAMVSGILLTFVNTKFTVEGLVTNRWGCTLIIGAMTSVFVYIHILMPKRAQTTPPPASILMPSAYNLRKNANTMNDRSNIQRMKISKRFVPWLLFSLLTISIALMVSVSDVMAGDKGKIIYWY
ncbi:MAG: hypothetical protein WAM42_05870 [Candidatus Nitrosopolaris sp.]